MNDAERCMITADQAVVALIDLQDRLLAAVNEHENIVKNTAVLIRGCRSLEIPIVYSEQYPQGLGRTTPEVLGLLPPESGAEKIAFSAVREPLFFEKLLATGKKKVILPGIETHVCVAQTALDLLDKGFEVFVPADAVGSRTEANKQVGLSLMERAGAVVTSVETVVFQCFERAGGDAFRNFQKLIR